LRNYGIKEFDGFAFKMLVMGEAERNPIIAVGYDSSIPEFLD
jgi:hypothetical protein